MATKNLTVQKGKFYGTMMEVGVALEKLPEEFQAIILEDVACSVEDRVKQMIKIFETEMNA